MLVFEEATSALDGVTEEAVLQAIENAVKMKTLIIIAHRLITVKNCDAVYILDKGRIAGSGTYDGLLNNNERISFARGATWDNKLKLMVGQVREKI